MKEQTAVRANPEAERWLTVRPALPLPDPIHFLPEELTLLLDLKLGEIFNQATIMDEKHNSAVKLFDAYARKREELTAVLSPIGFDGDIGHLALTEAQVLAARPKMNECNNLIAAMIEHADLATKESWQLLSESTKAFNEQLGLGHTFKQAAQ